MLPLATSRTSSPNSSAKRRTQAEAWASSVTVSSGAASCRGRCVLRRTFDEAAAVF